MAGRNCLIGRGTLTWVGHEARMEGTRFQEPRNAKRVAVEKAEGRRRLGIHMSRWNNNIKMDLKGTEY
jgi:hypothetical protein